MGDPRAKFFKKHEEDNKDSNKAVYDLYPKFSFEFNVNNNRSVEKGQKDERLAVLSKIIHLSRITWKEIGALPREQGFEKIDKTSFKSISDIPYKFKDEKQIDVFRLPSKKGRLMGFIENETFYIVWVDTKFNMYDH